MVTKLFKGLIATTLGLTMAVGVGIGVASNKSNPVFADAGGTPTGSWGAITSSNDIEAGVDYLLGYVNDDTVYYSKSTALSSSALQTSASLEDAKIVRFVSVTGGWNIVINKVDETSTYLGYGSSSTNLATNTSGGTGVKYVWAAKAHNDGDIYFSTNNDGRFLGAASAGANANIKGYATSNLGSYPRVTAYKKTQTISGSIASYTDETVALSSDANTSVTWSIVSGETTAEGASVTSAGVVSVSGAGVVKVKAVASSYLASIYTITFSVRPAGPVYSVSFDTNGGDSNPSNLNIEEGNTFEFPSPGVKEHYSFNGWSSDGGVNLFDEGDTSPSVITDIEYVAYWTEDTKVTVTYQAGVNGTGSYSHSDQYVGTYTLLNFANLTNVTANSGYRFKDYSVDDVHKNPGDTFALSSAVTVTVNFEEIPMAYEIAFGSTKNTNPAELNTSTFTSVYSVDGNVSCTAITKTYGTSTSRLKMGSGSYSASITLELPSNQYVTKVEAVVSDGLNINLEVLSGALNATKESQNVLSADTYIFDDYLASEQSNQVTISTSASGAIYLTELNIHYGLKAPEITADSVEFDLAVQGTNDIEITVAYFASTPVLEYFIVSGATCIENPIVGSVNGLNKAIVTFTASNNAGTAIVRIRDSANTECFVEIRINVIESVKAIIESTLTTESSLTYHYSKSDNLDTLNYELIGISGNGYSDWDNKVCASGTTYIGNSAGGNSSIQLRSSTESQPKSGIVTITSGGYVSKIKIAWNSNTAAGRTLNVYGKSTAYQTADDLYNDSNKGTLLGTIVKGTSTELVIAGEYTYVGFVSNSGAMYIDSIKVEWGETTYEFSKVGMRFTGKISKDLWSDLNSESTIQGYGILFSTNTGYADGTFKNEYANANGTTIKDFFMPLSTKPEPNSTDDDQYYYWNLFHVISEDIVSDIDILSVRYTAVAYIKTQAGLVFFGQLEDSVQNIAVKMLAEGGIYDNEYLSGSLYNFAHLS